MVFVIHWHESAMDLHVFPIQIPPPTSLSTWSLWVFPVHQSRELISCIQPGLVICFTIYKIHVSMLLSRNIPPSPSPWSGLTFKRRLWLLRAFQAAQWVKNLPAVQETQFNLWVGKLPWRRSWQPTPVFLTRESHGQKNQEGYSPQGHKDSDMTEVTEQAHWLIKKAYCNKGASLITQQRIPLGKESTCNAGDPGSIPG